MILKCADVIHRYAVFDIRHFLGLFVAKSAFTTWFSVHLHTPVRVQCSVSGILLNFYSFPNIKLIEFMLFVRVRNSQPSARTPFDSPSGILQESMDSHHIALYDKLKYLRESI